MSDGPKYKMMNPHLQVWSCPDCGITSCIPSPDVAARSARGNRGVRSINRNMAHAELTMHLTALEVSRHRPSELVAFEGTWVYQIEPT